MSFLKKIAKGIKKGGSFLRKGAEFVQGNFFKPISKITGKADELTGGLLKQTLMNIPIGKDLISSYQAGKETARLAKDVGKSVEKGDVQGVSRAITEARRRVANNPTILESMPEAMRRDVLGNQYRPNSIPQRQPQPRFGNMDIGMGSLAG